MVYKTDFPKPLTIFSLETKTAEYRLKLHMGGNVIKDIAPIVSRYIAREREILGAQLGTIDRETLARYCDNIYDRIKAQGMDYDAEILLKNLICMAILEELNQ